MSEFKPKASIFFTELDVLFDTRMGTIMRIAPDRVPKILKGYFDRERDQFPGIDRKEFADLYQKRDKQTLKASMVTMAIPYMREFCLDTFRNNIQTPFIKEPRILINIYPYDLVESELNVIRKGLSAKLNNTARIDFVRVAPEGLTPNYLKENCAVISQYDYLTWLDVQAPRFRKETCPNILMISPLMIKNLDDQETELKEFQSDMEFQASMFVNLQLFSLRFFSALVPQNRLPNFKPSAQEQAPVVKSEL